MEFHGFLVLGMGIPWNFMKIPVGAKFHGHFEIPWIFVELGHRLWEFLGTAKY